MTGLINLYAKCGELDLAHRAFCEVNDPQLSAWTTLIGGCVQQGKEREAIYQTIVALSNQGFIVMWLLEVPSLTCMLNVDG